jgi:hypothetical protein
MKKTRLSISTTLVLVVLNCPAGAEDIYSQLPFFGAADTALDRFPSAEIADAIWQPMPPPRDQHGDIILDADGNIPIDTDDQMTADNFTITESDAVITGVKWWGGSDLTQSSGIDNVSDFTVTIFTSSADAPDDKNVLYKENFTAEKTNPVYKGFGSFEPGAHVYEHEVTFSKPLELCQDAEYWISIGAVNFSPIINRNSYLWYSADPTGPSVDNAVSVFSFYDILLFFDNPVEWSTIAGDQAFVLKGQKVALLRATHCPDNSGTEPDPTPAIDITTSPTPTATPVAETPIPAAVWLFGSGLAGLFAVARRRKSKS